MAPGDFAVAILRVSRKETLSKEDSGLSAIGPSTKLRKTTSNIAQTRCLLMYH